MAGVQGTPHRVVDGIITGVTDSAKGVVGTIKSGVQGVGSSLQKGLDAPWESIGGPEQPLRAADRVLDGVLDGIDNAVSRGLVGSLQTVGEGLQRGLDHPVENFGVPPALLGGSGRNLLPELPQPPKILGERFELPKPPFQR